MEDPNENSDVGEHEDEDVKTERQKVSALMNNCSTGPVSNLPLVMVQNLHKQVIFNHVFQRSLNKIRASVAKISSVPKVRVRFYFLQLCYTY